MCVCVRARLCIFCTHTHTHTYTHAHTPHVKSVYPCTLRETSVLQFFNWSTATVLQIVGVYQACVHKMATGGESQESCARYCESMFPFSISVGSIHHTQKFVIGARCIRKRHSCARTHNKNTDTNTAYKPSTARQRRRFCSCQEVQ